MIPSQYLSPELIREIYQNQFKTIYPIDLGSYEAMIRRVANDPCHHERERHTCAEVVKLWDEWKQNGHKEDYQMGQRMRVAMRAVLAASDGAKRLIGQNKTQRSVTEVITSIQNGIDAIIENNPDDASALAMFCIETFAKNIRLHCGAPLVTRNDGKELAPTRCQKIERIGCEDWLEISDWGLTPTRKKKTGPLIQEIENLSCEIKKLWTLRNMNNKRALETYTRDDPKELLSDLDQDRTEKITDKMQEIRAALDELKSCASLEIPPEKQKKRSKVGRTKIKGAEIERLLSLWAGTGAKKGKELSIEMPKGLSPSKGLHFIAKWMEKEHEGCGKASAIERDYLRGKIEWERIIKACGKTVVVLSWTPGTNPE